MPLIKGKSQNQAADMAFAMRRKAQNKAMGGMIDNSKSASERSFQGSARSHFEEPEALEVSDQHHFGNEHDSELESYEQEGDGPGFKAGNVANNKELYNTEPDKFAKGGMCYAKGGEMHPVDMLMRHKFLSAQKKAYGGPVEAPEMLDAEYPEYEEDNYQMERTPNSAPMKHEASEDPEALSRRILIRKAMRR